LGLDDLLLVPAHDEAVHTSLPEPLSLVDHAAQFVTTYQGHESNSCAAVDSFVESLKISQEDQASIEFMTKGHQFINQKYRQYRRCMINRSSSEFQNAIDPDWQGVGSKLTGWIVYGDRETIWSKCCYQLWPC